MKPYIKYTGGKYREYTSFKNFIPKEINNYYEPFLGGGGVFFRLHEEKIIKNLSFLNDKSKDLMEFYSSIKEPNFINELNLLNNVWNELKLISDNIIEIYGKEFLVKVLSKEKSTIFNNSVFINIINHFINDGEYIKSYDFFGVDLVNQISLSLSDKLNRFSNKNISESETDLIDDCIRTAIYQGFYFTLREIYNKWLNDENFNIEICKKSSIWLFIREFCFGGMFRFSNGKFNIPYGGKSYNNKCLKCKIDAISSDETKELFEKVHLYCEDYETFLNRPFEEGDFIFFDPPYDSTFSEYDELSFDKSEQVRLSEYVKTLKCKWMMVVRKTPLICELYKDYEMIEFDKTYMYNARGEYKDKKSKHIIIKNYAIE